MARALWKGAITFGLVSIPVELHTAVRERGPRFRLLRRRDRSRVRYQRIAEADGEPVEWADLVKGYEYAKGHFIVLTREDFETAALEKTRTIGILDFVHADQIDDRFFDKPYYLTAGTGGAQAYSVLREAIRETGRVGIAKFVMRDRQHLAAIEAIGEGLVLSTMRFRDEVVPVSEYEFPAAKKIRPADLKLARMLVDELASDWNPEQYTDDYRDNLMRLIEAKRKGRKARLEEDAPKRNREVVDLMERLRRSLQDARGRGGGSPRPKTGTRKRSARAKSKRAA